MKIRAKYLIYLSALLIAYDALNIPSIPILDRKPLSLFISIIFIVCNIDNVFKIKYKKSELIFMSLTAFSIFIGLVKSFVIYNNDYIGVKTAINSIVGFLAIYISFRLYFLNKNKESITKLVKIIFYGYTTITIFFGSLQLIYGYIFKSKFLEYIFNIFLFQNINYIKYGRVHFLLAEPSFAGGYYWLLFVPTLVYLYKNNSISRLNSIILFIVITVLNICTFSNRFIIDSAVCIIIIAIIISIRKSNKFKFIALGIFISIFLMFNFIFVKNIFNIENNNVKRIEALFGDKQFTKDQSFMVRKTLLENAIKGFYQKPILGWGAGSYKYVLQNNYKPTINEHANNELETYMNNGGAVVTYSFYATTIAENGVLGILIVITIAIMCLRNRNRNNKLIKCIGLFILYIFIQNELNSYIPIMIWLAFFNSDIRLGDKNGIIKKVSIVTPCFNSEKTIERTIKSVVEQPLDYELEYIIVDGKSSDGTLEIIKKYANKYNCIKYISEKDNSMTEALNKGLKMATGDVIASINADDIYLPDSLNNIIEEFDYYDDKKIIMVNSFFVYDETNEIKSKNMPRYFNPIISSIIECPFPECGVFYRKECFDNVGFFNENIKYTQDYELYLRQYYYGYRFSYLDIDASNFYISDTNYSSTIMDKMEDEVISYIKYKKIFRFFAHSTISKILKILLGFRIYYFRNILKR